MRATRKLIQTVRFVMAGAVVLYFMLILRIPSSATPSPVLLRALGLICITEVVVIFVMRRFQLNPAEAILENQPEDPKALVRWRQGYIITYSISLSIALYGLVLHFMGFLLSQVAPFFVAGLVLILLLGPKRIPTNVLGQSDPIVPH